MPRTLIQIFLDAVDGLNKPAQFMRRNAAGWESIPAQRSLTNVEGLALGLGALGVVRGDRVAVLAENRYEWPVTDLAALGIGAVTVPIYPTLTAQQVRYILENAEAKVCVVSTPALLEKLREAAGSLPNLQAIVVMEPSATPSAREHTFASVMADGERRRAASPGEFRRMAALVQPDDLATIIYTSGTTGDPKGAMLSHGNVSSNVEACLKLVDLNTSDTCLSFLPLCHILERMAGLYAMLAGGVTIAYAQSLDTVSADACEVFPTVLTGVPRIFEKLYARVMDTVLTSPPLRKNLFFWGLHTGTAVARLHFEGRRPGPWLALRAGLASRLVGAKVRARLGGRVRLCISGGAPLAPKVMEFLFAVGLPVIEGYGLTETSPVICLNLPGRERPGAVGPPIPGVEVRIGPDGEILTRGPHVMIGYFRNPEATAAAIRDGWFHTGDVGQFDAEGNLRITDRLKDLLVTAGGKKVAPQPLEAKLKTVKWISEAVMLGDQRPYCVCLLVPNFVVLETEAKARGWRHVTRQELLARSEVLAIYQREVDRLNADLAPFEQIKKFALLDRDLSQDAGELTPTLKVKRRVISQKFATLIESLYANGA